MSLSARRSQEASSGEDGWPPVKSTWEDLFISPANGDKDTGLEGSDTSDGLSGPCVSDRSDCDGAVKGREVLRGLILVGGGLGTEVFRNRGVIVGAAESLLLEGDTGCGSELREAS